MTREELLYKKRVELNQKIRDRLLARSHDYPLTPADERLILLYYHQKINDICKYFKFPPETTLTAHLFFARVHATKPLIDDRYDLKHVMLATVYVASKVSDVHTTLSDFCDKIPGTDRRVVEELEFVLLDYLDFDILVDSPLPCLLAYIIDLYTDPTEQQAVYGMAVQSLVTMYMTDIPLLYNAAVIAMAALKQTAERRKDPRVEDYILRIDPKKHVKEAVQSVLALSASQATTLDARLLKEIDSRLTECRKQLLMS